MQNRLFILTLCASLFALYACEKTPLAGHRVENVTVRTESGTKATFNASTGVGKWQVGDMIRVQFSEGNAQTCIVTKGGSSTTIQVDLENEVERDGYAYYPAGIVAADASKTITSVTVTLPDTYNDYIPGYAPTPMYAANVQGEDLVFHHLAAMLLFRITLPSGIADVHSVSVSFDVAVSGTFTPSSTVESATTYYQIASEGSGDTVTYNLYRGQAASSSFDIFVPIPATVCISSIDIALKDEGGDLVHEHNFDLNDMFYANVYGGESFTPLSIRRGHGKIITISLTEGNLTVGAFPDDPFDEENPLNWA